MSDMSGKYLVGYGKPPEEHRFQKGQSGNPGGRPKGTKNKPPAVNNGYGMRAAEELLRQEAYRPVTLREGEQLIEMPAIQAVFRAMGVSAMKGNRFVQRELTTLVTRMEAQDHQTKMEAFGTAIDYKVAWEREMKRCEAAGLPEPEMIPHPDDIILNPVSGDVSFAGPLTKEHKIRLDEAIARRTEAQEDVTYFAEKYRRARDEKKKAQYLEEWHWEQRMFDIINDIMSDRYKIKLENRSYREGASREGKALDELRKNRALKQEYVG